MKQQNYLLKWDTVKGENMDALQLMGMLMKMWPLFLGFITLVIVLAKMHGDIIVLKEKVKVAFDLINKMSK